MPVNSFHQPSPLLPRNAIPYEQIARAGDSIRQTSDKAFDIASSLNDLEVDARGADIARRDELLNEVGTQTESIYDTFKSDPRQALEQARRLASQVNKNLTRGELAAIAKSKKAEDSFREEQEKLLADKIIDQDSFNFNAQQASQIGGIGKANEAGEFNIFKGRRGVNRVDLAKKADTFIDGYKSDKYPSGIYAKEGANGFVQYYDQRTNEVVDGNDLKRDLTGAMLADPETVSYIQERALTTGQEPQAILENLVTPYANKGSFNKSTSNWKLGKSEAAMLKAFGNPEADPLFGGHVSLSASGENTKLPFEDMKFLNGKLHAMTDRETSSFRGQEALNAGVTQEVVDQAKIDRDREQLRSYGESRGLDVENMGDEQLHKLITDAEKAKRAVSFAGREVSNVVSKDLAKGISRNRGSRSHHIIQEGKVLNPSGTIDSAQESIDDQVFFGGTNQEEFNENIDKALKEKGVAGVLFNVPGVSPGSPYVEIEAPDGRIVQVAFSPNREIANAMSVPGGIMKIQNSNTGTGIVEGPAGGNMAVLSKINPATREYETTVYPVTLKDINNPPSKPLDQLSFAEIETFYEPVQKQDGDVYKYSPEEVLKRAENKYKKSGLLGSELDVQKANTGF